MSACSGCANWDIIRRRYLTRLFKDIDRGIVDNDILDILLSINENPCIVTTSSCSGRIAVIAAKKPHDKRSSQFVFKKHDKIEASELKEIVEHLSSKTGGLEYVWITVQPMILYMYVCGYNNAVSVVKSFESIGFKYVCMKPTRYDNVFYVGVTGTERLDIPIKLIRFDDKSIEELVYYLNTYLSFTKSKLDRVKSIVSFLRSFIKCD